ncbi:MAG: M48 family metallopeptidase [Clostridia bacterium]|nr:M48 family metallopeptidase [Clostridia bacterium]
MVKPDEIIRSRRKTLSMTIDPFGRLVIRAPYSCGEERIFDFIRQKENWILKKQAERKGAGVRLPPENLDGYRFLLLGKDCVIRLTDDAHIRFDDKQGVLFLPSKNARTKLVKWLKENAKRIFTIVTERKAAEMQTTFRSVSVSSAKSKWGSCSYDNAIRYTFRLLYAPREIIEYVVTHELAHTKHKNHSAAFWAEVEKYVPDWKTKRKWLKTHGIFMEIF